MTTPVWIGLGSNLGDRKATLDAAVAALSRVPGVTVRALSSFHETEPVGGPPGQGPFLNAAAWLETTLNPLTLLAITQGVESRSGRVRSRRWGERTLDIDLLIFGNEFLDTPRLKLPHPRLALRRFVLAPLAEIAPSVVEIVSMRRIGDLLANLDRRPRLLALLGPDGRFKSTIHRRLVEDLTAIRIPVEDPRGGREQDSSPFKDGGDGSKTGVLRVDQCSPADDRETWMVTDYRPEADRMEDPSVTLDTIRPEGTPPRSRIRPIFAVLLDGGDRVLRPGLVDLPLLRPESGDPEETIAEVVATCRDIMRS